MKLFDVYSFGTNCAFALRLTAVYELGIPIFVELSVFKRRTLHELYFFGRSATQNSWRSPRYLSDVAKRFGTSLIPYRMLGAFLKLVSEIMKLSRVSMFAIHSDKFDQIK